MAKHHQARSTSPESERAIRRLLTLYRRQINHQQGQITTLESQIKGQELRVTVLQGIRRASTVTLELDSLFPVLLEILLEAVDADSGALLLIHPNEKQVVFGVQRSRKGSAMPLGEVSLKQGYRRQILTGGRSPLLKTLTAPPPGWDIARFKGGRASLLVSPLRVSGRVVGLVELLRQPSSSTFQRQHVELLTTVGHQLGMVLENARLYSEAGKRVGQFSTLMELSTILNSTLQFSEVLRRTVEAATRLMECEVGSLLLLNAERNELVFEVALGERGREVKEVRLKVGEGIAGWVAKTGKTAMVNDVGRDPRFLGRVDVRTHFITRNMICVPVKSRDRIIGVLQAINRLSLRSFTIEDQRLFESLARQVGIAIENARLYEEVKQTFFSTVATLAEAIEKRDPYTGGHVRRVVELSLILGQELGLSGEEMETLHLSAILHDVGKIGIRDGVLKKHGPLSPEEFAHIREHPQIGAEILAHIKQLEAVIPAVRYHQERCDGRGYPEGLKGEEIPLASRVIAVADTFDAMTTDRPYRPRLSDEAAAEEIERGAGTQFDPDVVEAFLRAYRIGRISSAALWALEKTEEEQKGTMSVRRLSEKGS
ncbi:MAG: GAF and HD-GYP domain-containing protein [Candidatus Methylomirabilales bacterium]